MIAPLPLPTLLSQILVAFTIEFDNEFERQMPHQTTISKSAGDSRSGPWLVSMVMWSNLMRLVGDEGATVGELQSLARTERLSLTGMQRWGYITVAPNPNAGGTRPPGKDWVVRPTMKGRRAREMWQPLFEIIEERWRARFGKDAIRKVRESLAAIVSQFDVELPEYLPVLGYGLVAEVFRDKRPVRTVRDPGAELPLSALVSKVLLAFPLEFEAESELSLAISANVIRLLSEKGERVRDLPRLAGVSKEAIKMAVGFLEKRGYAVVEPDPAVARTKLVRLTSKGRAALEAYQQRVAAIEDRWRGRFGEDNIRNLRESLEPLVGEPTAQRSPLFRGLEPHPGGWRASVPKPETLPHYPMVLHRGGYPDGS